MSCSGENLNKQQNRYPLHFGKQMEFYLNIVSLKRKFQCLAVSRMNSSNTNCIFFFCCCCFHEILHGNSWKSYSFSRAQEGSWKKWMLYGYIRKHSLNLWTWVVRDSRSFINDVMQADPKLWSECCLAELNVFLQRYVVITFGCVDKTQI